MTTSSNQRPKRTQRDYTLAFKLGVVERVEKANSLINRHKLTSEYKEGRRYWFGSESMVDSTGRNHFSIHLCQVQKKHQPKK